VRSETDVVRIFRDHLIAFGTAGIAFAVTVGALAVGLAGPSPASSSRTDPLVRVYPICPAHNRHLISSTTIGSATALIPIGARQALLCRYSGVAANRARALRLIALSLVGNKSTVDGLAAEFNALEQLAGAHACPSDSGASIIAFFRYGSTRESDDPVTVDLKGCMSVTNGRLDRTAVWAPGPALIRRLKALTSAAGTRSEPYRLYTHCGIEWARIDGAFWQAAKRLSDGHANPPAGWGNPYQAGTLTFSRPTIAIFRSAAGSVKFHRTARATPPFLCS
jgi:hypothetical protein